MECYGKYFIIKYLVEWHGTTEILEQLSFSMILLNIVITVFMHTVQSKTSLTQLLKMSLTSVLVWQAMMSELPFAQFRISSYFLPLPTNI